MKALLAEDVSPPAEEAVFSGSRIVLDDRVVAGAVVVRDGLIVGIDEACRALPAFQAGMPENQPDFAG